MIDSSLEAFLSTVTTDFNGLISKIDQMKDNMSQLKQESNKSVRDLHAAQETYTPTPLKYSGSTFHVQGQS